ncbi:hypothetical protein [Nocardia sp. NPDC058705]|uniref:hypothetical protein n=1 Tax=Nocardia sp. NPDC058705 TaxID=3346609 RepID=UPI003691BB75
MADDPRTATLDYLTALEPDELVDVLRELFTGTPPADDEPADDDESVERETARRLFNRK